MSPWALPFVFKFTFLIVVYFHQSTLQMFFVIIIYGLFAAAGERQGSDTLEAVKSCFYLQIKRGCFFSHFSSVPCVATRGSKSTETGGQKI